ncbi:MAG: aminotransferase class V-fold PLP-dependent enzyme [Firmicutes bacterium]|nr:aminotransferase class V-fold PLP-dependent enzyme [Bacillota bacterium]
MSKNKYKYQMYSSLQRNLGKIYEEARAAADEIGIPAELRGRFGLTGAISGCPAPLRADIRAAAKRATEVIPLSLLVDEIRELVKDVYGDGYDAAPINTCEAGLWVAYDCLFAPPLQGRGDNYRARYLAPYERHMHHQAGYGRPFPAKYKDLLADRGSTAGEMGFYGKRQNNLDVVIVPLPGAKYDNHGIKYWPVPLLLGVDPEAAREKLFQTAERHGEVLTGITSLGYDTPGYGYGVKDDAGVPKLLQYMAQLAREYNIPYVVDNAWGVPFLGTDISKLDADVMVYSMDKASGSATSGLIIGKEEVMTTIRRALGIHGDRWGTLSSYGKAAYVTNDPGKDALLAQVAALKALRDKPEVLTRPLEHLYEIVREEFAQAPEPLAQGVIISKSYNSLAVEINYEPTWEGEGLGFPIFSIEDMYAGSNILQAGLSQMGIIPTIAYDGNIFISLGLGTTNEEGELLEKPMRKAIKGLLRLMEIVGRYSGFLT